MIYTLTLNPALDKTVEVPSFEVDQVNRITQVRLDPGGKGFNVSKIIQNLGGTSQAIVALGGMAGQQWKRLAGEDNGHIRLYEIPAAGETRTNVKIVDPVRGTHTDINEPGAAIAAETVEELLAWLRGTLQPEDMLILSGSVPASVGKDIYGRLTALCHTCGARALVDTEGPLLAAALKEKPYLVKPNHHELAAYVGRSLHTCQEIVEAAKELLAAGAGHVLVSLGADGALLCWQDPEADQSDQCNQIDHSDQSDHSNQNVCVLHAAAPQALVASTVGAGDSMVGAFAYGWEQGMSRQELLRLSVAAGTAAVTCEGSRAPERQQVYDYLRKVELVCVSPSYAWEK